MEVILIQKNKSYNITDLCYSINLKDSLDTLATEMQFNKAISKADKYFSDIAISCGDIIILKDEIEVFRGVVFTKEISGLYEEVITAFDFLYYFNKSKIIKQYKGESVTNVIKNICLENSVDLGEIPNLHTKIYGLYYQNTISEIIADCFQKVFKETGNIYYMELRENKLYVFKKGSINITPFFKPAVNVQGFNPLEEIGKDFTHSFSIEEMKNSVILVNENGGGYVVVKASDPENIAKYGLLQEVETVSEGENPRLSVQNKLKILNKVNETLNLTLLGDFKVKSGRVINVKSSVLNVNGNYEVIECNHSIDGGIHLMTLNLEVI